MVIYTVDKKNFELQNDEGFIAGRLTYSSNAFDKALIETKDEFRLQLIATGIWAVILNTSSTEQIITKIKVETGGIMSIRGFYKRKKYLFKKSANFKLRFSLFNNEGEDMLTLIPSVNWQKESHDYILQLNDEFEKECDSFLILQAVHCANCSLSMMTGGKVPALVSI